MALLVYKTQHKCGSTILASDKNHQCYPEKNHDNEAITLKPTHLVHAKKPGDFCNCAGYPDCRRCGGTGIIS